MGKKKKKREAEAAAAAAAAGGQATPAASPRPAGSPAPPPAPPAIGKRQRGGFDDSAATKSVDSKTDLAPRTTTWDDDDAVEIAMIPDLDEVQEEDLALQVAPAPMAPVNRVATMAELNEDLQKKPAFMTLDDLDLHLLTRCLVEASDVAEPDKPWMWDVLFTEIMSEVQDETVLDPVSPDATPQASSTGVNQKSAMSTKTGSRTEGAGQ